MKKIVVSALLIAALLSMSACGGSGGGGAAPVPAEAVPTRAIVKLSTSGAASQIGGVDVTLELPARVTVKATAAPPETDPGVVVASGQAAANSLVAATYTAGPPGTVRIVLVNGNANGFASGEFVTITCELGPGARPVAGDFTVQSAMVSDGAAIEGATVTVSVVLE